MGEKLLAEWFWTDRWRNSSAFLLPLEAKGLYREMLTASWSRGGYLPNDPEAIQKATGVSVVEWNRTWRDVRPYWEETEDGRRIFNVTQLEILADAIARKQANVVRATNAANARWNASSIAQASSKHVLKQCPPSLSLSQTQTRTPKKKNPPSSPEGFDEFWDVWPNRVDKAAAVLKWRTCDCLPHLPTIVEAVERWKASEAWMKEGGKYVPGPAKWLLGRRWEDEVPVPGSNGHIDLSDAAF